MQTRTVALILKELLARDGLSATELHRRTGVPQSTLSRILGGKIVDPADKHITKLAEYFRVSTDQLRGRASLPSGNGHAELRDIKIGSASCREGV